MTARRMRRLAATACVAAAAIVAVPGCGGSDDPLIGVLKRADAADSSYGVRYAFRATVTDGKRTDRTRGYGQAEPDQRRTRLVVVMDDFRGETIVDGDDEYDGGDFAVLGLADTPRRGARWSKLDRARFLDAGYLDKLCGIDLPAKVAGVLADSDPAIEGLGAARVRNAQTQRYRVTTTYGRVLDVLAGDDDASGCADRDETLTAELWIDRDDLIRRVRLRYRGADGATVETRDITRYDRDVKVTVPGGAAVEDVTDTILKLADSLCKTTDEC